MLHNKLVVVGIGVVLTGLIYLAIAGFGRGGTIRRKAVIAALASLGRGSRHGRDPDPDRRLSAREQRGDALPGARGLRPRRERQPDPHRTQRRRAVGDDLAQGWRARSQQAHPLRARRRGHLAVLLPRVERFLSRQPGPGRGARRKTARGGGGKRRAGRPGPGAALPGQSALPVQHAQFAVVADHRPAAPRKRSRWSSSCRTSSARA